MKSRTREQPVTPTVPDAAAEEALLQQWEPLALRLAHQLGRRFDRAADREDLEQVARVGLLQAARRFDPERDCQFSTYAFPTIVGEVRRYLRDRAPALRFPRRWFELRPRILATATELAQTLGREPTVSELAEQLGVGEEEVAGALGAHEFYHPASLGEPQESPEGDEIGPLAEQIGVEDPLLEVVELRVAFRQLLEALPGQQRDVLRLRYFEGLTQEAVGRRLGVSQMQVSRLERRALAWLRQELQRGCRGEGESAAPRAVPAGRT